AAEGDLGLPSLAVDMNCHQIVPDRVRDRYIHEGIDLRRASKRHLSLLHDELLTVDRSKASDHGNAAAQDEGLLQGFSKLHLTTDLYCRTGAMDPGVAGDIHPDVGAQEGQRHVDLRRA